MKAKEILLILVFLVSASAFAALEDDFVALEGSPSTLFHYVGTETNVIIPDHFTIISTVAFWDCPHVVSITIPSSIFLMEGNPFWGCDSLKAVIVDEANPTFSSSDGVLFNKDQTHLCYYPQAKAGNPYTIPGSVNIIRNHAFVGSSQILSVFIPESVSLIFPDAFKACASLNSFFVEETNPAYSSLEGVLYDKNQTKLVRYPPTGGPVFSIPNSVVTINDGAFFECKALTSVEVGAQVANLSPGVFPGCGNLTAIDVNEANQYYASKGGILYDKEYTKALFCPRAKSGDLSDIPSSVLTIGESAFAGCAGIESIALPNSLTAINSGAFAGCHGLGSIVLPDSLAVFGSNAFKDCSNLTAITIPNKITRIEESAFMGCGSLASVIFPSAMTSIGQSAFFESGLIAFVIPRSVVAIGNDAFTLCKKMQEVTVEWETPLALATNVFAGSNTSNRKLKVPKGTIADYESAAHWNRFGIIEEYDATGIDPIALDNAVVHIYNDPAGDCIRIQFGKPGEVVRMLRVYDVSGRIMTTIRGDVTTLYKGELSIPRHGCYLLEVVSSHGIYRKQVII